MFRNKRGMTLAIVVLVMSTLFLTGYSLIAFSMRKAHLEYRAGLEGLGDIYVIEESLNYNIKNIMEDSSGATEEEFINSFKANLAEYREGGGLPQLAQIDSQLTEENIEIDENVKLTLDLKIEGYVSEDIYASYNYTKTFKN